MREPLTDDEDMERTRRLEECIRAFLSCGAGTDGDNFWEDYDSASQEAAELDLEAFLDE